MIRKYFSGADSQFNVDRVLAVFSVMLGVFIMGQSFYYQGIYTGFSLSAASGGICYPVIGSFCLSDADPYAGIIEFHTYLNGLLLIYTLAKLVNVSVFARVTSFFSLGLLLFFLLRLWHLKVRTSADTAPYFDLLRQTLGIETLWIGLVAILLVLEIVPLLIYGLKKFN